METWLSGRKRLTANEVGFNRPLGFESRRLRQNRKPPKGGFLFYRSAETSKVPAHLAFGIRKAEPCFWSTRNRRAGVEKIFLQKNYS